MTALLIAKEIVYDRESREYAIYITIDEQREYIGSTPSYHDAELKCNDYAYHYYADNHTPEVAAAIAVGMSEDTVPGENGLAASCELPSWGRYIGHDETHEIVQERSTGEIWKRPIDDLYHPWRQVVRPPPAHRSITVGYDGEQCDLVSIAAQVLAPLAHLRPIIRDDGAYLVLSDRMEIPAPQGDHAIVVNMIDRLNEVIGQLPARPTSITAWMHVGGEIYQVARNREGT